MTDRERFSDDAHRWMDGEPSASPGETERDDADRLWQASAAYAGGLEGPGSELDAVIMESVRHQAAPRTAPRRSLWRWLVEPWTVRVRPAFALAAAMSIAIVVFVTREAAGPVAVPGLAAATGDVRVRFELTAPEAGRVTVAGTFNDWNPDSVALHLNPVTGVWSVTVPMRPGEHQYLFVVDGARWIPDPGALAEVEDGFGQKNSLLVVPAGGGARS